MTILTNAQRKRAARNWVVENFVRPDRIADQHGGDILAAVAAIDDLLEANQAAMNNALPEPFKSKATPKQKASLFQEVMGLRHRRG